MVKPEEDLVFEDGRARVRNFWFYKKWGLFPEIEKPSNADLILSR